MSSHYSVLKVQSGGDEQVRTVDPLRAKQVLSQLSYTPVSYGKPYSISFVVTGFLLSLGGLKWNRTIDLALIRRAL